MVNWMRTMIWPELDWTLLVCVEASGNWNVVGFALSAATRDFHLLCRFMAVCLGWQYWRCLASLVENKKNNSQYVVLAIEEMDGAGSSLTRGNMGMLEREMKLQSHRLQSVHDCTFRRHRCFCWKTWQSKLWEDIGNYLGNLAKSGCHRWKTNQRAQALRINWGLEGLLVAAFSHSKNHNLH